MKQLTYRENNSLMSMVNPLCKMVWVFSVFIASLIIDHPLYLSVIFLSTIPVVLASAVFREWLSMMKFALYLGLTIIILNTLVSYHGAHVIWQAPFSLPVVGVPTLTAEAMIFGSGMSLRLLAIISAFSILTLTIHPDDILQSLLKLKIPFKPIMVTSLSTRFIPTLVYDAERISAIQRTRGLELDRGNFLTRIKRRTAVLIPLLSNSLERTVQVAEAMESRGFSASCQRTFYKDIKLKIHDIFALAFCILPLLFSGILRWQSHGSYQYFPSFGDLRMDSIELLMLGILIISVCSVIPIAFIIKRLGFD